MRGQCKNAFSIKGEGVLAILTSWAICLICERYVRDFGHKNKHGNVLFCLIVVPYYSFTSVSTDFFLFV